MEIFFFFQAEDGIRDLIVTGVQTCALPISFRARCGSARRCARRADCARWPRCGPKTQRRLRGGDCRRPAGAAARRDGGQRVCYTRPGYVRDRPRRFAMRTQILGSGFVTGQNLVTNDQLARMMDTSDGWIRERSGVETRYYVEQGTTTSDLGAGAARKALEDAGVAKEEIDYIVFATMTPDHYFPGCGGILQDKLGLSHVPALDIRQQCTGFIYGLQISDAFLKAGQARTVLLVGAEVHTGFMPWTE